MSFYKIELSDGGRIYFQSNVKFIIAPGKSTIINLAIRENIVSEANLIVSAQSVSYEEYMEAKSIWDGDRAF